jgi:hypothetical protein
MANPFDDLDDDGSFIQSAPAPGLWERFQLNFEAGNRQNTIAGAIKDNSSPLRRDDRARFERRYDSFPAWQGLLDGGAALSGQIAGTAASPENFVPVGLGEKILVAGKIGVTGLWARIFSGAVDSAASNAVADAAIQGINITGGTQQTFNPEQYAASVLLGFGVGGLGGAGGKVVGDLLGGEGRGVRAAPGERTSFNPFDELDDNAPAPIANTVDVAAQIKPAPDPQAPIVMAPEEVPNVRPETTAPENAPTATSAPIADQAAPPPSPTIGETLSAEAAKARGLEQPAPAAAAAEITPDIARERLAAVDFDGGKIPADELSILRAVASPETEAMLATSDRLRAAEIELKELRSLKPTDETGFDGSPVLTSTGKSGAFIGHSRFDADYDQFGHAGFTENERPGLIKERQAEIRDLKKAVKAGKPRAEDLEIVNTVRSTRTKSEKQVGDFMMAQPTAGLNAQRSRGNVANAAPAQAASGRIERVRETADALAKALNITATRQGRISGGKRVLGTFDTKDSVVRVRSLDDFDTLTHEYGHHLDAHVPDVKAFIKTNSKALSALDYDPSKGRDFEGFAEFFRLWVTNRDYLRKNMPALAADFEQVLTTKAPEMAKAIDEASAAWNAFLSAPSSVAVRSTIVSAKKDGWIKSAAKELKKSGFGGTISDVLQRIYTFGFDDLNPINRAVSYLKDLHYENKGQHLELNTSGNPYKLARMSRGAYSAGHMDVMYGVAPYRGMHPESPSLRDAIVEATGKPNALSGWDEERVGQFGAYLWSRRAVGEWERYRAGDIPNPPDKLTEADHHANIAELEKEFPAFVSAADKAHEFSRALWKKKLDAGLIDQETYDRGLLIKDYVPGLRDFSTSEADMKITAQKHRGGSMKGGLVKRFKGSKRDVINPLESMAADAYETNMTIARNDVVKALHRLSLNAGPGSGAIAEIIPTKELRASMIDPLEAVETAARNAGLSVPDITVLRDAVESAVGSEKAAIFRPAMINEKGEPIVFFRDGGQLKALRLADGKFGQDMYKAITMMGRGEKNFWLDLVSIPARVLRAGITLSPEFIGANFVRDQFMATVLYGKPFRRVAATLQGATDDIIGSDVAKSYARMFGISGGAETASLSEAMAKRDLAALKRKGWFANRLTSFRGLLETAEIAETATRLGLFRTFKDEAKARGLSDYEATLEASWQARDYLDFDRRGSGMAALSRVIPFLNASLQGLDKASRHMIAPLARKMLGVAAGPEDTAAMALAVKTWARLGVLVAGSVSLYALQSQHEDYDEVSETTKATHWMVKDGEKWVAIPKPFEMAIAINLGEALFDSWAKKDPAAMGRWRDSIFLTVTPPSLIEGNPAIKSYFELKANKDLFTGAPIVPDQLQGLEPWLQYTARTSALSKQLGRIFNEPPVVIDHLITAHLGSWGRNALALYDLAQPDAPGFAWDDAPITRRFIKDASRGAQSVTMFWDMVGQREGTLEGKVKSWKAMMEAGDSAGAADYYATLEPIAKAYVAVSSLPADARRLHPMIRARGAVQAIGTVRREMAMGRLTDDDGNPLQISSAERTAADDVFSSLAMAMARNALKETGVAGWAQRTEIPEDGYYRELEAINPRLAERLGSAFAQNKVWTSDAVNETWPELRDRALADGSDTFAGDLVAQVQAGGLALDGEKRKKKPRPVLHP